MITSYINLKSLRKNNSTKYQTIKKWINISFSLYIPLFSISCKMEENSNYGGTGISKMIQEFTKSDDDEEEETNETTRHVEESTNNTGSPELEKSKQNSSIIRNKNLLEFEKHTLLEKIHSHRDRGLSPYINKYLEGDLESFYITHEELKNKMGTKTVSALSNSEKQKANITCLAEIIGISRKFFIKDVRKAGEQYYKSVLGNTEVVRNPQSRFYCSNCDTQLKYERFAFADRDLRWCCENCKDKKPNQNNANYIEIPMICILDLPALGKEIYPNGDLEETNYLAFCLQNLFQVFQKYLEDLKQYKKDESDENFNPEKLYNKFTKYQYNQILELHLKKTCIYNILRYVQNEYNPEKKNINYLIPTEALLFLFDLSSENVYDLINLITAEGDKNEDENKKQLRKNLLLFSLINELPEDFKYKTIETIRNQDDAWIWDLEQVMAIVYSKSYNSNYAFAELREKIKNISTFATFAFPEDHSLLSRTCDVTKLMLLYRNFDGNLEDIKKFIKRYERLMNEKPNPSDLESLLRAYSDCSNEEVKDFIAENAKNYTINQVTIMLTLPDVAILSWAIKNNIFKSYKAEDIKIFSTFAPVFKESGLFSNLENLSESKIVDKIETNIRTSIGNLNQHKEEFINRLSISNPKGLLTNTREQYTIKKEPINRDSNRESKEVLNEFTMKKREKSIKYPELEAEPYNKEHSIHVSEVMEKLESKSDDEEDYNEMKKLKSEIKSYKHNSRNSYTSNRSKKITPLSYKGISQLEQEAEHDLITPKMHNVENSIVSKRNSFKANEYKKSDYKVENNFNSAKDYFFEEERPANFELELMPNRKVNESFLSRTSNKGGMKVQKIEDSLNLSHAEGKKNINRSIVSSSMINELMPMKHDSGKSRNSFNSNKNKK